MVGLLQLAFAHLHNVVEIPSDLTEQFMANGPFSEEQSV